MYRVVWLGDAVFMAEAVFSGGMSVSSPRRRRSAAERRLIVEETLDAGSSVARVALKHGVNANQVFKWKRLYEAGRLGTGPERAVQLLPVAPPRARAHWRTEWSLIAGGLLVAIVVVAALVSLVWTPYDPALVRPQALVPAGTWQRAKPAGDAEVLVSCVVSPGFDITDFRV